MNQTITWKRRRSLQLLAVSLLVILPIVMIIVNGSAAFRGIFWKHGSPMDTTEVVHYPDTTTVSFGVFDPNSTLASSQLFAIEHIYLSWTALDSDWLATRLQAVIARNRWPLITIEPWPYAAQESETLLTDVTRGRYDQSIRSVSKIIDAAGTPALISWGHEMDQRLVVRYPWSDQEADAYRAAYAHVHGLMNSEVSAPLTWVWAPVVTPSTDAYWPGDALVDVIAFPVYSFPAWDQSYHGYIRSFNAACGEKYDLVKKYNKPVMIIELGVEGSHDYRRYWLQEVFTSFSEYPLLKWVVFHNSADSPKVWGEELPTPDWRLEPGFIEGFIQWYLNTLAPVSQ